MDSLLDKHATLRRAVPRLGGATRVWLLTATMAVTTLALYVTTVRHLTPLDGPISLPWWALAVGFYFSEAYVVHLHYRREAHTLSMNEIPIVLGLFLATTSSLLVGQLVGAAVALVFYRRQRALKVAFNLALFAFGTTLALLIFHAIATQENALGPVGWLAAFLGAGASSLSAVLLVGVAIWLAEGRTTLRELPKVVVIGLVGTIATVSLAVVAVQLLDASQLAALLLLVPAAACALAFQAYSSQRSRHEHLEFLYESMRTVQGAPDLDTAVSRLLESARGMLRADCAELILVPRSADEQALYSVARGDGEVLMQPLELGPLERLACESTAAIEGAIVLPKSREAHELDGYLATRGLKDAMLATLRGEQRALGVLVVGDRSSDVSTFGDEDRRLFETFAGHASILLENDRLEQTLARLTELQERLRHQAFHDALTGLPNRAYFTEQVAAALGGGSTSGAPIVLFIDLDDFKTFNDSLGHAAGDELLKTVADRVIACVRPGDTPARLGGDEFAVLLHDAKIPEAERVSERIMAELRQPFQLHGREVAVHTSIGIATAAEGVASADELLRNADVAMYSAKGSGKRLHAVYEPAMHRVVARRHDLALALEQALVNCEIRPHFQPIVSLKDGRIVALEALARWRRPARGLIAPEEFIPLAEETGLMVPIGRALLRQACEHAVALQQELPRHRTLGIAVNLSATELDHPGLREEIATILAETGLAPGCLMLEVTESSAMREAEKTIATLRELRALGVRLALDDFGTGYSSLSHLRELPIDLLKIPKPFVDGLHGESFDPILAQAIVGLASSLRLSCVAEGIEDAKQAWKLAKLGCDMGQGHLFGHPLAAEEIAEFLRRRNEAPLDLQALSAAG
jgi:diguanylate cyclase (GGDEF)-like protein